MSSLLFQVNVDDWYKNCDSHVNHFNHFMRIYIYTYIHISACILTHTNVHICIYMYMTHVTGPPPQTYHCYIYRDIYMNIYMHDYFKRTSIYARTCVCIYQLLHTYICAYIHFEQFITISIHRYYA